MREEDRFKVYSGPYRTPRFRLGKVVEDEWRGDVTIVGVSNGRIAWPVGQTKRAKSLVVYGGLSKAIRRESVQAVAYWFGVTPQTVTKWRNKLGIAGENLKGTRKRRPNSEIARPMRISSVSRPTTAVSRGSVL